MWFHRAVCLLISLAGNLRPDVFGSDANLMWFGGAACFPVFLAGLPCQKSLNVVHSGRSRLMWLSGAVCFLVH